MKQTLAIFLLSAYLVSTTELSQFLKLPVLIGHYIEHKDRDEEMSFIDYLVHHYVGHEKDGDYETDMKLPFMAYSKTINLIADYGPNHLSFFIKKPAYQDCKKFAGYKDIYPTSAYFSDIWQPPKSC